MSWEFSLIDKMMNERSRWLAENWNNLASKGDLKKMIVYIPLLIAIIGLLIYALSNGGKIAEIGRIMFWTGLLATLMRIGGTISLLK